MASRKTKTCDFCKKVIRVDSFGEATVTIQHQVYLYDDGTKTAKRTYDLCVPCRDEFYDLVEELMRRKGKPKCSTCGRAVGLTKKGRFRVHQGTKRAYPDQKCPGSGREAHMLADHERDR